MILNSVVDWAFGRKTVGICFFDYNDFHGKHPSLAASPTLTVVKRKQFLWLTKRV
jgi:hypothetical protein